MEIVEPRKIYENWRLVMVHNITSQVFELPITSNTDIIH